MTNKNHIIYPKNNLDYYFRKDECLGARICFMQNQKAKFITKPINKLKHL